VEDVSPKKRREVGCKRYEMVWRVFVVKGIGQKGPWEVLAREGGSNRHPMRGGEEGGYFDSGK